MAARRPKVKSPAKRKKRAASRARPRNATLENPALSLTDPKTWEGVFAGSASEAGISINECNILTNAAFWQGTAMISADIAGMTLNCHQRTDDDDRDIDRAHPAQILTSMRANRNESAYQVWRRHVVHGIIYQDAFVYIERLGGRFGKPVGLYNLLPDRTCAKFDERGELYYVTEVAGRLAPLFKEEVLHLVGLSTEPHCGLNLTVKARNAIGLALAAEGFSSKFFANGAQMGGILEIPLGTKDNAKRNLEEGWSRKYSGKENWFKTAILRDGVKFHATMIDAQKSQTHELREDQAREVSRFLNLPPFKLGLQDSISYNSSEHAQKIYLTGCLNSWRNPIAAECNLKLLTEEQILSNSHYFEHNTSNLIELDFAALTEGMVKLRSAEILNANECRRKLNLPRRKDPGGDDYTNPNINPKTTDPSKNGKAAMTFRR